MTPETANPQPMASAEGSRSTSSGDVQQLTGSGLSRLVRALEAAGCEPTTRGTSRCPAHDDRRPSLHFKQGMRGALVVCRSAGCSTEAIAAALGLPVAMLFDDYQADGKRPRPMLKLAAPVAAAPEPEPDPLLEIPEFEIPRPGERVTYVNTKGKTRTALAADVHVYRRGDGRAHHVVIRCEPPNDRKWFCPLQWESRVWRAGAQPRPATLYGLELLAVPGLRQIVLVEGEKAADALNVRDLAGLLAMTWHGGADKVDSADWSPLAGLDAVLWPDADDPGRAAMTKLAGILAPNVASLKMVRTDDLPKGHDAADVDADTPMLEWLRGRVVGVRR